MIQENRIYHESKQEIRFLKRDAPETDLASYVSARVIDWGGVRALKETSASIESNPSSSRASSCSPLQLHRLICMLCIKKGICQERMHVDWVDFRDEISKIIYMS